MEHFKNKVLTIAGSDSGAGAGIQADLKTFSALGVYGVSVITAVTAQNSIGVQDVRVMDEEIIKSQIDSVLSDIGAICIKTGMLAEKGIINLGGPTQTVYNFAKKYNKKIKKIHSKGEFPKKIDMNLSKFSKISMYPQCT